MKLTKSNIQRLTSKFIKLKPEYPNTIRLQSPLGVINRLRILQPKYLRLTCVPCVHTNNFRQAKILTAFVCYRPLKYFIKPINDSRILYALSPRKVRSIVWENATHEKRS